MPRTVVGAGLGLLGLVALAVACTGGSRSAGTPSPDTPQATSPATVATTSITVRPSDDELAHSGGVGTVFDESANAFAMSDRTLTSEERRAFAVGNNFFNDNWVTAPASTTGRDGLGPTFNAQSCSSCHFKDGRAQPTVDPADPQLGLLLRLSVPGEGRHGEPIPDPVYGGQLQDRSINGVPAEGTIEVSSTEVTGTYGDGTTYTLERPTYRIGSPAFGPLAPDVMISPRIAPPVFGVGLLEAIPEATIVAAADRDDADGDGVSGRPNRVWNPEAQQEQLGRFGWKANVATVESQDAGAFNGDIGITSNLAPTQDCPPAQTACLAAPSGGSPEIDDAKLERVVFYNRTLAVPARRDLQDPDALAGEQLFTQVGCASCHTPEVRTGASDIASLANQVIRPYTDLLLHDMGDGLADGRPDGDATGREWRTPPLWGIGLTFTVNGHTRFLHDGRARNLTEAILWHGGEAAGAQERFRNLPADQRTALVRFLDSL